jgi:hypothetical protein
MIFGCTVKLWARITRIAIDGSPQPSQMIGLSLRMKLMLFCIRLLLNQLQDTAEKYKVIKKIDGYSTAADAKTKNHKETTVIPGTYYIFNKSNGMINVTNKQGVPGNWINPGDNKEIKQEFYPIEKGDNFWVLENKFKLETAPWLNPKVNPGQKKLEIRKYES